MQYHSIELLKTLRDQHERIFKKLYYEWRQLPAELLNQSPGTGSWSATQCLAHLNSYGRYYLPAIEKALQQSTAAASGTFNSGWLGNYFYQLMLPGTPGKPSKKMKSPKNHAPATDLNAIEVVGEFIDQLKRLSKLLVMAEQANLQAIKVPISIAPFIRLRLGDVLLFYTAHIQRHVLQAEKALQAAPVSSIAE